MDLRQEFSLLSPQGNTVAAVHPPLPPTEQQGSSSPVSIDENVEQLGLLPALLGMPITLGRWYVPKDAVSTLGYEP